MRRQAEEPGEPSRSEKKRAAQAVEEMVRRLAALPPAIQEKLPLEPELRSELKLLASIRSLQARDRQLRHLAGQLRRREEAIPPLEEYLAGVEQGQLEEREKFHRLEQLRDRLCSEVSFAAAAAEVARELPAANPGAVASLARAARNGDRNAARALFRLLRDASV